MEFYRERAIDWNAVAVQQELTIERLPLVCSAIDKVLWHRGNEGAIYCLWGEFDVQRQCINGGVRFTLPGCPNALGFTVTTGLAPQPALTVIHCTINRREHEADFVASIDEFLDALADGLATLAARTTIVT